MQSHYLAPVILSPHLAPSHDISIMSKDNQPSFDHSEILCIISIETTCLQYLPAVVYIISYTIHMIFLENTNEINFVA